MASRHSHATDRVAVSGSSGTIGRALLHALRARGVPVARLVRGEASGADEIGWRPADGWVDAETLGAFRPSAVIHLAGESVFGWFSHSRKQRIHDSRVTGTRTLVDALVRMRSPPGVLLSASAVGYYGDGGDGELSEASPAGGGFLADVCRAWEGQTDPAARTGIRTVTVRIGVVLSPGGGALGAMRPIYRLGLGGPVAGGRAWVPWISLDDTVAAVLHLLESVGVCGLVNVVGPQPARQGDLARRLGAALRRPAIVPVPRWAVALAMGELGRETVLKSVRAVPRALLDSGFTFAHSSLDQALAAALGPSQTAARDALGSVVS